MKIAKMKSLMLVFFTLATLVPMAANADRGDGRRRDGVRHDGIRHDDGRRWHGDIRVFQNRDLPRWRAGNWHHGVHQGHLGWWWVVGGLWYLYPQPVYPYPDAYTPPVVVVQPPSPAMPGALAPQTQNWYYCTSARSYYPYVPSCPEGWKAVPATPPDVPDQ